MDLPAAAFLVVIVPLGVEVLPNAVLTVGLLRISRETFPSSALHDTRRWFESWRSKRVRGDDS